MDDHKPSRRDDGRIQSLLEELRALLDAETNAVRNKLKRTLPFGDYVSDRWRKAAAMGFGTGTSVYDSCLVLGDVKVGENTWIGPFTVLDGSGGLQIGDYCSISAGVQIYTHDTVNWATSGGAAPVAHSPVHIGSRCYIGPQTVIVRGVTVGDGCIIGANSLVNCDLPANSKAWGTPCRIVGMVEASS